MLLYNILELFLALYLNYYSLKSFFVTASLFTTKVFGGNLLLDFLSFPEAPAAVISL